MTQHNDAGYQGQLAWQYGQLPQPPAPVMPKKRRRWPWITLGAVIVVIVIVSLSNSGNSGNTGSRSGAPAPVTSAAAPAQDTIVYTITGGHSSDITFMEPGEGVQESQITDRTALPWTKTWTLDPSSYEQFTLSIEAQNASGGTIGCSIAVNGKVVAQNSSSGEYAVVTCSPQ